MIPAPAQLVSSTVHAVQSRTYSAVPTIYWSRNLHTARHPDVTHLQQHGAVRCQVLHVPAPAQLMVHGKQQRLGHERVHALEARTALDLRRRDQQFEGWTSACSRA